jgi:hypothetical protein
LIFTTSFQAFGIAEVDYRHALSALHHETGGDNICVAVELPSQEVQTQCNPFVITSCTIALCCYIQGVLSCIYEARNYQTTVARIHMQISEILP